MTTTVTRGRRTESTLSIPQAASAASRAGVKSTPSARTVAPARTSRPRSLTLSPMPTPAPISTSPECTTTRSTGTTVSAPAGTTPPVEISIASPTSSSDVAGRPAADRSTTRNLPGRSAALTAYPSIAELRNGGRSIGDTAASARILPAAPASSTRSVGRGSTQARMRASASVTVRSASTTSRYTRRNGVPSRRDLGRHPRAQRRAKRGAALRRAGGRIRGRRPRVGGRIRRRRLDRRDLRRSHPTSRCAQQRVRRSAPAELR